MGSGMILPGPGQPKTGADPSFATASVPNLTTFSIEGVAPPTAVYVQRDDQLLLQASSSIGAEVVTFAVRIIAAYRSDIIGGQPDAHPQPEAKATPATTIVSGVFPLAIAGTYGNVTLVTNLAEGFLLSLSAIAASANQRGQTFARALLLRAGVIVKNLTVALVSDYVTSAQGASWPSGRQITPIESNGAVRTFSVGNPAAGADWNLLVPVGARWRLMATNAQLVTSAAVATRVPELQFQAAAVPIATFTPNGTVAASLTAQVSGSSSVATNVAGVTDVMIPIGGPIYLLGNQLIQSVTRNIQAADQWSNIRVVVEEWLDF
jgi:hypothetical protein